MNVRGYEMAASNDPDAQAIAREFQRAQREREREEEATRRRRADFAKKNKARGVKYITILMVDDTPPGQVWEPPSDVEANRLLAIGAIRMEYEREPMKVEDPTLIPQQEMTRRMSIREAIANLDPKDPAHFDPIEKRWNAAEVASRLGADVSDADIEVAIATPGG